MLLGHDAGQNGAHELADLLAPDVNPALVRLVLRRSTYTTAEERDAEALASLVLGRSTASPARRPLWGARHRWRPEPLAAPLWPALASTAEDEDGYRSQDHRSAGQLGLGRSAAITWLRYVVRASNRSACSSRPRKLAARPVVNTRAPATR